MGNSNSALKQKKDPLVNASNEAIEAHQKRLQYRRRHASVISEYERLVALEASAESALKSLAREKSVPGVTVLAITNDDIKVSVQGRMKAPEYDVDVVEKTWPEDLVKVTVKKYVDTDRVKLLVEAEMIDLALVQTAALPRKVETPAVIITYKDEMKRLF